MVMRQSFSVDPDIMERIDKYSKSRGIKREEAILELVEAGINFTEGGGEIKSENKRSYEEFYKIRKDLDNMQKMIQEIKSQMHDIRTIAVSNNKQMDNILQEKDEKPRKKGLFNIN
ncbi:type II secretion system protein E [Methanolacinia petrolearia]|nr:type II secretion system protein E [Methanolacinia petrolearia]